MVKQWIELIKKDEDRLKNDLWSYNISGNVIEFLALPSHGKEREAYRCSVIKIGQVLQALSVRINKTNVQYHIQSFPNIENFSLIASIRVNHQPVESAAKLPGVDSSPAVENQFQLLLSLASNNQLMLDEIPESCQKHYAIHQREDIQKWFVLSSDFDNPFTWLKIGYWIEMISQTLTFSDVSAVRITTNLYQRDNPPPQKYTCHSGKYLQAIAGLKV